MPIHMGPDVYGVEAFVADPLLLSSVVEFDKTDRSDVSGLTLAHPQCHIGTDTLSWEKPGATVTGIDFSLPALAAARDLEAKLKIDATFIESELYAIRSVVAQEFEVVYTGVGAIN